MNTQHSTSTETRGANRLSVECWLLNVEYFPSDTIVERSAEWMLGAPNSNQQALESTISRVFKTLLLNFSGVFPDDVTAAGINQLEGVEDVIAGAF